MRDHFIRKEELTEKKLPDRLVREDCARMYKQQPLSWREASEESVDDARSSPDLSESPR